MDTKNESINTATERANLPVFMDTFLACGHLVCALLGTTINVMIIQFIIFGRHLRRHPRNIIWIGIGFSNIFILLINILELSVFYYPEATELCRARFFLNGFPATTLLVNYFFSLVERYLSIFHLIWYRRYVTVRLVGAIQLAAFVLLFFLMKSHYIFGLIEVKCTVVHPVDRTIYFVFITFFIILCLSGQLTLYKMIKQHLEIPGTNKDQNTNGGITTNGGATTTNAIGEASALTSNIQQDVQITASRHEGNENTYGAQEEAIGALQVELNQTITKQNHQFVRIRNQMVSRLELEATRNVMLNVGLLLLFSSTWITSVVLTMICQAYTINQDMDEEQKSKAVVEHCSLYHWAISYTRFILLIAHSIYQSISYIIRSKDFCSEPERTHIRRRNGYAGAREVPARKIRHHPQKKRNIYRSRYNRRPRSRLEFEQPIRNEEVDASARQ